MKQHTYRIVCEPTEYKGQFEGSYLLQPFRISPCDDLFDETLPQDFCDNMENEIQKKILALLAEDNYSGELEIQMHGFLVGEKHFIDETAAITESKIQQIEIEDVYISFYGWWGH